MFRGSVVGIRTRCHVRLRRARQRLDRRLSRCTGVESLSCVRRHPNAVRQSLTRRREQQNKPPPVPVDLPKDPRVRDIAVRDHDLTEYDGLAGEPEEDSEE